MYLELKSGCWAGMQKWLVGVGSSIICCVGMRDMGSFVLSLCTLFALLGAFPSFFQRHSFTVSLLAASWFLN
jgi:hypothetical protein